MTDQSGAYEYGIACNDGEVWDDRPANAEQASEWLIIADVVCGCEEPGHHIVRRAIPRWEPAPAQSAPRSTDD